MDWKKIYGPYKIFDAQVHLATPKLEYYREGSPVMRTMWAHNNAEQVLKFMDGAGIDKALVETPCLVLAETKEFSDASHVQSNKFIADAVKKAPVRLVGVARVNPNYG